MSTDLTPDPEASLPDSNASESESQPNESAEIPVESPVSPPIFPELLPQNGAFLAHFDLFGSRNLAPFRLRTILLSTLIFGLGGVYLAALNWRRLGKPKQAGPTLILGVIGLLGLTFVYLALARLANYEGEWIGILAEMLGRLAVGGLIIQLQRPDRERWLQLRANHSPSVDDVGGCRVYFQAYIVGSGFAALMRLVVVPALLTFVNGASFLTQQLTYSLGSFDVTYDSSWRIYTEAEERSVNCGTQVNTECLIVAVNSLNGAEWFAAQMNRGIFGMGAIEGLLVGGMEAAMPGDFTAGDPETTSIDGHDAIIRNSVAVRAGDGGRTHILSVAMRDGNKIIWMLFSADERVLPYVEDRFQRILDSIDFHDTE